MDLKTLILVVVDGGVIHGVVWLIFGNYRNLIKALSNLSVPVWHVPFRKNFNYDMIGQYKIMFLLIVLGALIVCERYLFY